MATIDGTAGNDTLIGTSGDDLLNGLAGNDSIEGRSGNDTILGGEGADSLFGNIGSDSLDGGNGADALFSGPGNDTLLGGEGNDTLNGFAGNDSLNGGPGDDLLIGRRGTNVYDDFSGFDTVDLQYSSTAITVNINGAIFHDGGEVDTLASGIERVSGSFFGDIFNGSGANDDFVGITGNDTLIGGDGSDRLDGGAGDDQIEGQGGNDTLLGGSGNDLLMPGSGANSIDGGDGEDTLSYAGNASAIVYHADGTITHDGGINDTVSGIETLVGTDFTDVFNGGDGNDYFVGGIGNDVMVGGGGNDTFDGGVGLDVMNPGSGDHALLIGGPGSDQLSAGTTQIAIADYATSPTGIFVDVTVNTVQDGFGSTDTLLGIRYFIGSAFNDTLSAGAAPDRMVEIYGGGGDDSFVGGGFGTASTGLVRLRYDFEPAGGQIDLSSTGFGMFPGHFDTLVDIHDVFATPFNDTIFGSIDPDKIDAGAGDDYIVDGASGNDTIATGAGNDTIAIGLTPTSSTIDFGSGDDAFTFTLVGAPPPVQGVGLASVTTWQATSPTTLMVTQAFDGDVFGRAVIEKSDGTLTLDLASIADQSFDVAPYQTDLVVLPNSNPLTGTLGQGDDVVIAGVGDYSLDGGGGHNTVDYSELGSAITAAIDGDQATVQLISNTHTLQRFSTFSGTQSNDIFTSAPFDATAPFDAGAVTALLETGLPPDLPTVLDSHGDDSYRGRMIVDFRGTTEELMISPTLQPGVVQAVIPGDVDTLQDVTAVLLPTVGSTVDYGNNRNVLLQVSGGSHHLSAAPGSLLSYATMTANLSIDLAQGLVAHGNGNDTIAGIANVIGGSGDDTLTGDGQNNILAPAAGNNTVDGGGGNDTVVFGFGVGALGDQVYFPESQRLLLLTADTGAETAESVSHVEAVAFTDQVVPIGDFGRDLPTFTATTVLSTAQPSLFASLQNDDIDGSASADIILDRGGANRVDGSSGNDLIRMATVVAVPSAPPEPAADLPPGLLPAPPVAGDDALIGGEGSDTILAGAGADIVDGSAGDDLLFGDGGADSIGGGGGNDLLFGGAGNDLLFGEDGNDSLFGDQGQDILVGGAGDDRLYGDGGDLELLGGGGFDILAIGANTAGLANIDLEATASQNQSNSLPAVSGIEGVDASLAGMAVSLHGTAPGSAGAVLIGSSFGDTIAGGSGNDTLVGRQGGDLLAGGAGNDRVVLDAGNDTASGGSGADSFVYAGAEGSGAVQITDFVPGQDRMVLSGILAADGAAAVSQLGMTGIGASIDFGDGRTITFVGVAASSFQATDFLIDAGL